MTRGLVLCLLLGGCALVDQRTFNPQAAMRPNLTPPAAAAAPAPEPGPRPLLTVRLPADTDAMRADVARAVAAARRAKPTVVFDVVETAPAEAAATGTAAEAVGRLIVAQGVPAARVHLLARPAPAGGREVRVYVR